MKILLLGGTGFLGKSLLQYAHLIPGIGLVQKLTVASRRPIQIPARYCQSFAVDQLTIDVLDLDTFPTFGFDAVIHAADIASVSVQNTVSDRSIAMIRGAENVVTYCRHQSVPRLMYISSGAVYSENQLTAGPVSEHLPIVKANDSNHKFYAYAKQQSEKLCLSLSQTSHTQILIARCFTFAGSLLPFPGHYVISNLIYDAFAHDTISVFGDGTPIRSYMHQSDLAMWLWSILLYAKNYQIFNVGSPFPISISDLALLIRDLLGPNKLVKFLGMPDTSPQRRIYIPDVSKAFCELNLTLAYSLEQSILETIDHHLTSFR